MQSKPFFWLFLISGLLFLAGLAFTRIQGRQSKERNRGDYLNEMAKIAVKYQKNVSDKTVRLAYAQNLFILGEFAKSQELLQPLLTGVEPPAAAIYLSAHIEYLQGHYSHAMELIATIPKNASQEIKLNAQLGLLFAYYQTNQYSKARNLFKDFAGKIQLPLWDLMKAFGAETPYRIDWHGKSRSTIPFVMTDPLPVISLEINGQRINAIIDTGGELFYLDEALASSLGIKAVARQVEPYAGGKTVEVGYGRADSLTLGDVSLKSIPIKLGPIQRIKIDDRLVISGILTTGVLQQFLTTIDYPEGRLILRPRTEAGRNDFQNELRQHTASAIPFVLSTTHLMIAKGSINDRDALNLFIDSGLADSQAALALPKQTLDYLGIPVPSTEVIPDSGGGLAGGGFPVGRFAVKKFGLGTLAQENTAVLYGIFPPALYRDCEFIIDGLLSHNYLKKYKWTIDFSTMTMFFAEHQ
jgi:hypothetical protein